MKNMLQGLLHMLRPGIVDWNDRLWIIFLENRKNFRLCLDNIVQSSNMQNETNRKLPCQILDTFGQVHYKTHEQHFLVHTVRNLYMPIDLQSSH